MTHSSVLKKGDRHRLEPQIRWECQCAPEPVPVFQRPDRASPLGKRSSSRRNADTASRSTRIARAPSPRIRVTQPSTSATFRSRARLSLTNSNMRDENATRVIGNSSGQNANTRKEYEQSRCGRSRDSVRVAHPRVATGYHRKRKERWVEGKQRQSECQ